MIEIYSKNDCPRCDEAVALCKAAGLEYSLYKLDTDYTKEELLALAPHARSVPQIFSDGRHVGGLEPFAREVKGGVLMTTASDSGF